MRQSKSTDIDLDWHTHTPPPVADDQNFAMIPLFKPLFEYRYAADGQVNWQETNWLKRDGIFSIDLSSGSPHSPEMGSWEQGRHMVLKEWQVYFRGSNFPAGNAPANLIKQFGNYHEIAWPMAAVPQKPATDILLALSKFDPKLAELREGSARPYSRFPVHYEELPKAMLPHLGLLANACKVLQLRAIAELDLGKSQEALADVRLSFYCADAVKSESFMVSQLVRARIITENMQPVWEGLRAHQWTEQNLIEIQHLLSGFDLLSDYERVLKAEPAFLAGWIGGVPDDPQLFFLLNNGDDSRKVLLSWLPRGWYYQNELSAARFFQENTLPDVLPETQRAFPGRTLTNSTLFDRLPNTQFTFVFRQIGLVSSPQDLIEAQNGVNMARIACGLERWWMAHGHFPETLQALVPEYLDTLPHDIINGEPLKYHLKSDGQFILYSVGWNETDDGGIYPKKGVFPTNGMGDSFKIYRPETGDWVWQYPEGN